MLNETICIAIDFDECLVKHHLCADFGQRFDQEANLVNLGIQGSSEADLGALLSRYKGFNKSLLENIAKETIGHAQWREGARDFLKEISSDPKVKLEIISSGLDIPILAFLDKEDISADVTACTLVFEDDICIGYQNIISTEKKAAIVQNFIEIYGYNKVFSVGHSHGDLGMMQVSQSFCIPSGCKDCEIASLYISDHFYDVISQIEDILNRQ